ncbi:hypothetical protein DNTS_025769, partial [Danionella cerebrum]
MKDEKIRWWYEGETIAEIDKERNLFTVHEDVRGGSFRNRLKLDNKTGTLTITDFRSEHSGRFSVSGEYFSVDGGAIRWRFGDEGTLIAKIKGSADVFEDVLDGRFRDRLKLDSKTGTLTISNIRAEHAGDYRCYQRSRLLTVFRVSVY